MKKILCFILSLALLACSGCGRATQPAGKPSSLPAGKPVYTNLDSAAARDEVRDSLTEAGIRAEYVDALLRWAEDFNGCMRGCEAFSLAGDFTAVERTTVDYGEYYPKMVEWYRNQQRDYADILCRIAAFELVQDIILVENTLAKEEFDCWDEDNSWLFSDGDVLFGREAVEGEEAFPPFPLLDWDENTIANYFTLFDPIPAGQDCSQEEMLQAIQEKWQKRGISFQEGAYSLITFWSQNSGKIAVSHAAVLVEAAEGYLLVEKTNPLSPYAVTKWGTSAEAKQYLYDMMELDCARYDSQVGTYVILQNDQPF